MAGGRTYVDSHAARRDRAVPYRKETIFAALDAGLIFAQDARSLFQQDGAAVVRINVAGNDAADISGLTGIHCGLQHARNERPRKDKHIRSEERRGGKECVSTFRSWGTPSH